ncbi:THAP domain-containing protein 3 isoform X2 [Panthera pardus]|uniref:THAP domain-containing protein 3 isoform X2 n=1 Tax=Panthera pardus TaxID=9691 RepID=A0A9W2V8P3_PANPR|nr:THAP domain-containing protein 3 isoform X2 [Panthera pardus]
MPKSCAARQCCNRYSSRRKQLTFHRFPFSRPELLKEWVLNIGRGNFKPKQHTVICSEHFRPECFSAFGNRKNLKQNAVPTVFAFQDAAQVVSEAGPAECGLGRKTDAALEALPPHAGGPVEQVRCGALVRRQRVVARAPHGGGGSLQTERSNPVPKWEPHSLWPRSRTLRVEWAGGDVRGAVASRAGPGRVPARHGPGSRPWDPPRLHALCPQVSPQRPQGSQAPGQPASPAQPSDHSYALLDLDALKKKLFLTLKENEKLRKRLKAQRLVIQRMSSRLRAHRAGQPGLQARPPPEQQS